MPVAQSQSDTSLGGSVGAGSEDGRRPSSGSSSSQRSSKDRITALDLTLHQLLGKGSYGSVYSATSTATSHSGPCACKVLPWGPNEVSSDLKKVRRTGSRRARPADAQGVRGWACHYARSAGGVKADRAQWLPWTAPERATELAPLRWGRADPHRERLARFFSLALQELRLLQRCNSEYIVRAYGMFCKPREVSRRRDPARAPEDTQIQGTSTKPQNKHCGLHPRSPPRCTAKLRACLTGN